MFDFLKSATAPGPDPMKYRAVLQRQVDHLRTLLRGPQTLDEQSRNLQITFAASLARGALKQVLPPDSDLYALYTSTTGARLEDQKIDDGQPIPSFGLQELEFYELVLANLEWPAADNTPGTVPAVETAYSEVSRMLPGLVQRHWMFKAILVALSLVVVFAFIGVIRYGTLAFDIQKDLNDKKEELRKQVDLQKTAIDALAQQTSAATIGLADTRSRTLALANEAGVAIKDVQTKFANDAARKVDETVVTAAGRIGEAESAVKKKLVEAQQAAITQVNQARDAGLVEVQSSVRTSIDFISKNGLKDVLQSIEELKKSSVKSDAVLTDLNLRNSQIAAAQGELRAKQEALGKGLTIAQMKDPKLIDRAAVFLGEAVTYVWIGIGSFAVFMVGNLILLGWNVRLGRRVSKAVPR